MEQADVLRIFEESNALLNGHFQLRSGLHSNQFFQCAHVLKFPWQAEKLCVELAEKIRASNPDVKVEAVIAPALGGIPVGHEMGRAFHMRSIFAEKEDGKLVLRRSFKINKGERFLVAEDVITRGGRVQETIDIVEAHGGVVEAVGVLVDRSGGKAKFSIPHISLLELEPVTWEPEECPLCKEGVELVHPGSK